VRAATALVLVALLSVCCSSAARPPVSIPGRVIDRGYLDATAKGQEATVTINSADSYFSPTFIRAAPGARVRVSVVNTGVVAHTFTIDALHIDAAFGKKGDTTTVDVTVPSGNPLVFYCKYHQAAGMQGAIYSG
jgi:plastocyanin